MDVKLEALKDLYIEEIGNLEKMDEYNAEKVIELCAFAMKILEEVINKEADDFGGFYGEAFKKIAIEKRKSFRERQKEHENIRLSKNYNIEQSFISKIEKKLKEDYGLIPERDPQGNIVFKKVEN